MHFSYKVSAYTANTFYLLGLENLSESEIILDNMVLNPWGKKSQSRWPGASQETLNHPENKEWERSLFLVGQTTTFLSLQIYSKKHLEIS